MVHGDVDQKNSANQTMEQEEILVSILCPGTPPTLYCDALGTCLGTKVGGR